MCKVHIVQIIVSKYLVHIIFSHQTYNAHAHIEIVSHAHRVISGDSEELGLCKVQEQNVVADL